MKTKMIVGAATLLVAGTASAALVGGFDQRYVADDFGATTAGVWDEAVSGQDATAVGTFTTTTTPNGSAAVVNEGAGQEMLFTRDVELSGSFTIQAVVRLDSAGTDSNNRQGPFALDEAAGWSGLYLGANAGETSVVRAGNMGNTGGGGTVLTGSAGNSLAVGTWGVYTLIGDQNATDQLSVSFNLLSNGSTAFAFSDSIAANTDDIGGLALTGRLFGGDMGGGANGDTDEWLGAIAEVVVYNSALTTEQATANGADFIATYQIPEPATLGLIAAFGGGLMFIRRRFSM